MEKLAKKLRLSEEDILRIVKSDIDVAKSYYESEIKSKVEENIKLYQSSDEYYNDLLPTLSKKSKFISSDVADAVEAVLADLMDAFFSSNEVISIRGVGAEDEENAKVLQDLCNYQINRLNKDSYVECYNWFKNALYQDFGVLKVTWEREYVFDKNEVTTTSEKFLELKANKNVKILSYQVIPAINNDVITDYVKVQYELKTMRKNQPKFECIPHYEFLIDPEARTVSSLRYAIHRKNVTASYLRQKEASKIYSNVEKAIEEGDFDQSINTSANRVSGQFSAQKDEDDARKQLTIYEYWGEIDYDKDGILEPVIVTICGNQILSIQDNFLDKIPFAIISPFIEESSPIGKGFAQVLKQIQNLKTALVKELAYNVAQSNDTRLIINTDYVNLQDYIEGRKVIRARGNMQVPHVVFPIPFEQIHPATFQAIEYFDTVKENRSGITRYNQGLDAKSLNKTATGINLIMQASNKRIKLIVRTIAETGIKRFFELLVSYNLKFIDGEQVRRLLNKTLMVSDDFEGKFDFEVNASFGFAQRTEMMNNLNNILGIQTQVLTQFRLVEPKHIYNTVKKMLELMGFKNADDFILNIGGMNEQQIFGGAQQLPQEGAGGQAQLGAQGAPEQGAGGMQAPDLQALAAMLNGGMAGT